MAARELFQQVLESAIRELREHRFPVFTFALFHDHESRAVSVCADTAENSSKTVQSMNRHSMKYFMEAVAEGDLEDAGLWQANIGRSLSLGDFALVNLARTPIGTIKANKRFYLDMIRAVVDRQADIAALAPDPQRLLLACSGPELEVAYVWSISGMDTPSGSPLHVAASAGSSA